MTYLLNIFSYSFICFRLNSLNSVYGLKTWTDRTDGTSSPSLIACLRANLSANSDMLLKPKRRNTLEAQLTLIQQKSHSSGKCTLIPTHCCHSCASVHFSLVQVTIVAIGLHFIGFLLDYCFGSPLNYCKRKFFAIYGKLSIKDKVALLTQVRVKQYSCDHQYSHFYRLHFNAIHW